MPPPLPAPPPPVKSGSRGGPGWVWEPGVSPEPGPAHAPTPAAASPSFSKDAGPGAASAAQVCTWSLSRDGAPQGSTAAMRGGCGFARGPFRGGRGSCGVRAQGPERGRGFRRHALGPAGGRLRVSRPGPLLRHLVPALSRRDATRSRLECKSPRRRTPQQTGRPLRERRAGGRSSNVPRSTRGPVGPPGRARRRPPGRAGRQLRALQGTRRVDLPSRADAEEQRQAPESLGVWARRRGPLQVTESAT